MIASSRLLGRHRYEDRCPKAVQHYDLMAELPDINRDWYRCSGLVECEVCGAEYYDHPPHPYDEFLHIVCNGDHVKL